MNRRITLFRLTYTFLLGLISISATAQGVISGNVVDEENNPLPGVTIVFKGTTNGTTTDFDGNYQVSVPDEAYILVFSYIGFKKQEVMIDGRSVINVQMSMDIGQLSEIVVIGYGSREKSDVTGAMATITPKDFNPGVISNPAELMQGRISGVQVTPSSGEPGAAINVNIRGVGSIRSGNNPLFVIDGVPMSGGNVSPGGSDVGDIGGSQAKSPLNFLNPDDIASIDVLKDASATAIYGSRGANGVVLITTKKGKSGEAKLAYSGYAAMATIREKVDVLSAEDYRNARILLLQGADDYDFGANTDWQDEIFRTGISQNHSISFSGGSEKGNYRISIGYMDQEGIVITSGMKKLTGRINLNQTLMEDRLKIGVNLTASNIRDKGVPIGDGSGFLGDALANALKANPTMPVRSDTGYFQFSAADRNPVAMINLIDDQTTTDRVLGNVTADFRIIEGLHFNMNLGMDKSASNRHINYSDELVFIFPQNRGDIIYNEYHSQVMENFLNFRKQFGESSLNAMAGYAYQRFQSTSHGLSGVDYGTPGILPTDNMGGHSGLVPPVISSNVIISELQSLFGRVEYSYQDKYLATVSFRRDGSTRFGPDSRYGFFPSGALAWRLSEETFLKENALVSDLKLRLGWGQVGNQEFEDYRFFPIYAQSGTTGGVTLIRQPRPDLQWETTTQSNVGLDFGVWSGRISGTIDYFYKSTTDLLLNVPLPGPSPTPTGWRNLKDLDVINQGIEFSLTGNWVETKSLSWSSTINFARINNTVKGLGYFIDTGIINGPGLTNIYVQRLEDGYPLQSFYLREFVGYDESGISLFAGANGEEVLGDHPDARLAHVGSPYPDFTFSINNTLTFRGFDLNIFIDSKQGQMVYNNTANAFFNKSALGQAKNITYDELYSARSVDDGVFASTKYLEDASFIRLASATFGYNVPVKDLSWISNARFYITGQNLYLLTDYSGYDPEVNTNKAVAGVPSFGIDYTSYPRPRTLLVGVNVSF